MTIELEDVFFDLERTGGMPIIPAGATNVGTVFPGELPVGTKIAVTTATRSKYELTVIENGRISFVHYKWGNGFYENPQFSDISMDETLSYEIKEITAAQQMVISTVDESGDSTWVVKTSKVGFWVLEAS